LSILLSLLFPCPFLFSLFRYRCDRQHVIRNRSKAPAQAIMICILKAAVME
jgi:hypothetical protein